jgi:hypothetical protein
MIGRLTLAVVCVGALTACTASAPSAISSATAPDQDPGPPPDIPTTEGAILTLSSSGVSPKQVRVFQGSRVTFLNQDSTNHEIQSNPLHLHTDCPALNGVGFIVPGQSRTSDPFPVAQPCGFHDHTREGNVAFYGTVFVDPRQPRQSAATAARSSPNPRFSRPTAAMSREGVQTESCEQPVIGTAGPFTR